MLEAVDVAVGNDIFVAMYWSVTAVDPYKDKMTLSALAVCVTVSVNAVLQLICKTKGWYRLYCKQPS